MFCSDSRAGGVDAVVDDRCRREAADMILTGPNYITQIGILEPAQGPRSMCIERSIECGVRRGSFRVRRRWRCKPMAEGLWCEMTVFVVNRG